MRRSFVYVFFFLIATGSLFAQEHPVVVRLLNKGVELHREGKLDDAIGYYEKALGFDKKSPALYYELAYANYENEDYRSAVKAAKKQLKYDTLAHVDVFRILGKSYVELGKLKKANSVYQKALEKHPADADLLRSASVNYLHQKKYKEAQKLIERAIKAQPADPANHAMYGNITLAQNYHLESLLSLYFSLLLQPKGEKAELGIDMLKEQLNMNLSDTSQIKTKIGYNSDEDLFHLQFFIKVLNRMVLDKTELKSEQERLVAINEMLFDKIEERYQYQSGFVWDFYISFYLQLKKARLIPAMSNYILQSDTSSAAVSWLDMHAQKQRVLEALVADYVK